MFTWKEIVQDYVIRLYCTNRMYTYKLLYYNYQSVYHDVQDVVRMKLEHQSYMDMMNNSVEIDQ